MHRTALLLVVLLCVAPSWADTFTAYSGDTIQYGEKSMLVSVYTKSDASFPEAVTVYEAALRGEDNDLIAEALNDTRVALADAKSDDALSVKIDERTLIVPYNDCKRYEQLNICFTAITYLEEDAKPLGDGKLDSVKFVDGETLLPVTLTITEAVVAAQVSRYFSPATVYPGDTVHVTVTALNSGVEPANGVSVVDYSPLPVRKGKTEAFVGALGQNEDLTFSYDVQPSAPGEYLFSGSVQCSNADITFPDSTVVVKSPVTLSLQPTSGYVGEELTATATIENTYSGPVTLTDFRFENSESYVLLEGSLDPKKSFSEITLDPGERLNTSLAFTGTSPGSQSVTAYVEYETNRSKLSAQTTAGYERKTPTLTLQSSVAGAVLQLTIHNDGPDAVDGIAVRWSDGDTRNVARLKPDADATLTHEFSASDGEQVSATVTAPAQGVRAAFAQSVSGSVGEQSSPAEVVPDVPVEQTPPAQETETPSAPQAPPVDVRAATAGDQQGFFSGLIHGFVDFLDSLFG